MKPRWFHRLTDYGMLLVLLLLCLGFSLLTISEQHPTGAAAAEQLALLLRERFGPEARVLIVTARTEEDRRFADRLLAELPASESVVGTPRDARLALVRLAEAGNPPDAIAGTDTTSSWLVLTEREQVAPSLAEVPVVAPSSQRWPIFLNRDNLRNIANQIAIIAIVAIGMTMVIITGGIDLSVGSLIALSAVTATLLIRNQAGGLEATAPAMVLASLAAMAACGVVGGCSGTLVTVFRVPPFIVTLAVMLVASGLALRLTEGESVYEIPNSFVWLGRGADLLGIPNAVVLLVLLYLAAHVLMTRTTLGRYLYAVGGNAEAARLAGVPVRPVIIFAYAVSGLLAGLGGVIMASQLKSGSPNYGGGYELAVIAAVVVGGTSLSGGEGRMFGTLIGALIIAVIQNGMNLTSINPFTQKIVLGLVILAAVLLDRLKHRLWLSAEGS